MSYSILSNVKSNDVGKEIHQMQEMKEININRSAGNLQVTKGLKDLQPLKRIHGFLTVLLSMTPGRGRDVPRCRTSAGSGTGQGIGGATAHLVNGFSQLAGL